MDILYFWQWVKDTTQTTANTSAGVNFQKRMALSWK